MNAFGLFDFVLEGQTIDAKLAYATELGFTAVEANGERLGENPSAYLAACRRHGVAISCVTGVWLGHGVDPDRERRLWQVAVHERYIRLAAAVGAPRYIFVDHIPSDPSTTPEQARALLDETMASLAACAEQEGVTIFIEALYRKFRPVLDTVRSAAAYVAGLASPNVRIMVDNYHMEANGEDVSADTAAVWPHVGHVHVSDYQPPPAEPERPFPGGGSADQVAYLRPIVAAGYRGPIILEGSTWGDKRACLIASREAVERALKEAGA